MSQAPAQTLIAEYLDLPDTEASDELFHSGWDSRTLAYALADEFSIYADNPKRLQFLAEFGSEDRGGWVRGNICRALAAKGVTLSVVNRRKS
ncbi:hypothetical protein AQJ30_15580 [Streptomyces longwoodensis]|uniref:Uncharacterized protein n=1 Tax=Streptomyces longwoodensis TaxID=68231 RepID=A0A101QXA0_9ACTN|nr:hypothetical protein [Streptomyces longwoodensis]KUN37703.1 hypothetical protein AQJ30_15580 [Streptomyces longwoodensis]